MNKFRTFKNYSNNLHYYHLEGPVGETIGHSKGYPNKRLAVYGIIDVKTHAISDDMYEIVPDGVGRYDVHLKNQCGDIILMFQGCESIRNAEVRKEKMKKYVLRTMGGDVKRLTRSEIKKLKSHLCRWRTPQDMLDLTNDVMDRIGPRILFGQAGLEFLREAWIAAKFSIRKGADEVRLVSEARPDFALRTGGNIEAFEATEAMPEGEKRGDEYREGGSRADGGEGGGPKEWDAVAKRVQGLIRRAVQKKLDKNYPKHTQLVIYLNPGSEYGTRHREIKSCFLSAMGNKREVLEKFDAVWILWDDDVYEILSIKSGDKSGDDKSGPEKERKKSVDQGKSRDDADIIIRFGSVIGRQVSDEFVFERFALSTDHVKRRAFMMPSDKAVSEALGNFGASGLQSSWNRALHRRQADPEGAITAARSLLESVCKHILDDKGVRYDEKNISMHDLYKLTAIELNLSPDQNTEDLFRKIGGGCSAVVSGLGELRNRHGDAHGSGQGNIPPASRHAGMAVNLAGSMGLFLIRTYAEQRDPET